MADTKRLHTPEGTPPSHRTLLAPSHGQQVLQVIQQLFREEHLCDYTVVAEGHAFRTHRTLLAAVSDYFRVMLTGPMLESRQDHVELKGVTAAAVKVILEFAYSGQLRVNLDDVGELLVACCHLQVKSAIDLCCEFLLSEIGCKTCVDILNTAEMFSLVEVRSAARAFVLGHFEKLADTDQFYKLSALHLHELLRSDQLRCDCELTLFLLLTKWIDMDHEERAEHALSLMRLVRFSLMRPEELVDRVARTPFMLSHPDCRALLDEALHYHVLPSRHPLMQTPRTQVRNEPCLVAFGGRYGISVGYKYNSNKMFALHDGKWVPLPCSESNFLYSAAAVLDNFMYVCGGMGKPAHARTACHRFDPRTGTWTRLAAMKSRRQSFPLVAYAGRLYAFGGGTPSQGGFDHPPTDKCETYSIDRNEWTALSPLPANRKSSAACELGAKIYVSGGRNESETVTTLWRYDVIADTWATLPSMLCAHAGHAMVTLQGRLYVMDRTSMAVETFRPDTAQWSKLVSGCPASPLAGVARPAVFGHWVYFVGFMQDGRDFRSRRVNLLTREREELPAYPEHVHCVIGASLALPRHSLADSNNNSNNQQHNNTDSSFASMTSSGSS